jgi:hypothetical protein
LGGALASEALTIEHWFLELSMNTTVLHLRSFSFLFIGRQRTITFTDSAMVKKLKKERQQTFFSLPFNYGIAMRSLLAMMMEDMTDYGDDLGLKKKKKISLKKWIDPFIFSSA